MAVRRARIPPFPQAQPRAGPSGKIGRQATRGADARGFLEGLKGLTAISTEAAAALADHDGPLDLSGLAELSPEAATALARHDSGLELNGLTELPPDVSRALARHRGWLYLTVQNALSREAAAALASYDGGLRLTVTTLTEDAAAALATRKGELRIEGLQSLSVAAAEALVNREERLWVSESAAEVIELLKSVDRRLELKRNREIGAEILRRTRQSPQ